MIFNVQKCSIHDGEGLRTLVFFKGCPLRCPWCANPESQSFLTEIMESPAKCIGCGMCFERCGQNAIESTGHIDRRLCPINCTQCADICYAEAKKTIGEEYEIERLLKEIKKDVPFYNIYGGGVTFSGGEPFMQGEYLTKIAKECKKNKINVAVESCGFGKYESFESALPYIDSIFMDIKIFDDKRHEEVTNYGNKEILANIKRISEYGIPMTIRTPIVPGYTDSKENITQIAEYIRELPSVKDYELLVYHNLGASKYASLGRKYELTDVIPPADEQMRELTKTANAVLEGSGKECYYMKDNVRRR